MAEPALNALGVTVQNLTNGSFKKSMLMYCGCDWRGHRHHVGRDQADL
jgi:hypothetical protein